MDKIVEYFCTECEREIDSNHVHIDYGFVKKHKFNSKGLYTKTICVKNKHLCICERCWNNFANEYMLYSANAMERKKNKNF